jgi:hypothetical protein
VRHQLQQGRLAVTVATHDANALAFVDADGLVDEDLLARPFLRDALEADENAH